MKKLVYIFGLIILSCSGIQAKTIKVNNQSGFPAQVYADSNHLKHKSGRFYRIQKGTHTINVPNWVDQFAFYYHGPHKNCSCHERPCSSPKLSSPAGWKTNFNKTYTLKCRKKDCC